MAHRQLTIPLSEDQKNKVEALLNVREGSRQTVLAWLRQPAGGPFARNLLAHLERLQALRQVGLPIEIGRTVHQNHLLRLARLPGSPFESLRSVAPLHTRFSEAFEFRAVPAARKILDAVEVLKRLSASKAPSVPEDAHTEFVRRRWASHVFTEVGLDCRYYELCTLTELRNA